jgi:hypothetical protein
MSEPGSPAETHRRLVTDADDELGVSQGSSSMRALGSAE